MQLVLHTHGLKLDVNSGIFHLTDGEHERSISPELIDSISILSGDCLLTARAVRLAAVAEVPIYFHDDFGDADACLRSAYFESLAKRRRGQVYFSDSVAGATWVIEQFLLKTEAQADNLHYLANRRKKHAEDLGAAAGAMEGTKKRWKALAKRKPSPKWASQVMGHEGAVARTYWQALSAALPVPWRFKGRSRRPAQDPYNALTNYCYGILYARVERALFAAGLDPHLGILHADEYDRPTLAYDLIEPFRPWWVDRFLLQQIIQFKLDPDAVESRNGGWWITHAAKKELVPNFNQYFQGLTLWRGQRAKREGQVYRHAQDLVRTIDATTKRPG